ncbi:hypothetical protein BJ508DRAFT_76827 [Ascobolus immersus RN42]|uniref:Uncharacterized protein n=1 Tax=Ascobolus immersus RN42 TaxID=1160509 RepID=A0A3N4HD78_ASCIM|nr:hypothetical protein BJ508DRAFT_76827 [Ascobolus immersus RN42]
MAKYAAAFLGAEKINQYDLVRVTGPGIDKLDLPRIEAGYWKFLPLPLTEALMRVSCWIVYRDEEDTITHINVRGQLYSPFPLKAEYEVKEVTADEKVPVRHESVRKWPGIQNLETDAGWKATWFQYFPSIPGEVEIPVYADNQTPLRPRTDKENTSLELRESLSTPVMPLTPANIKDAHERFENMRVEGIEAMKTEISARWQEHWSFEPWEESLLRATDILGRFYSPNELYACAAMHEYPTPKPGLRVPIELGAAKVSKVAPQRAQAFGWSGFGTRDTKGEARDGELVHNLPASEKAELDQAVAEEPGLARSEMHWEEKEAVRPNRPKEGLVAMSEEEHRDCTKGAEDLIPRIDQRVVRRIGPVPGSWEDVQGSEAVWTPELVGAWEREDEKGNQVDRKKWVEYVERLKREEVGVISLDTSDEEEEESEGESDEEEEEDTITVKAAGNKEESKSTPNGEVRRREVVVTPRKEQRRPVDGRTILTGPAPPRPLLEDENRRHSLPSKGRTLTQAEREGRLETLKPIDGKKLLAAAGFGEKRKRHSIDNSAATKRAHVEKNGATPERIKVKRRERVEVSPDELSPVHPAGVTKERRLSWESPGKRQLMSTVAAGGRLAQASQGSGVLRQTTIGGGANEVRTPAPKISSFFPKVPKSTNGTQTTPSSSSSSSRPLDSTPGSAGGKSNGKHKSVGGSAPMWTGVKRHPNAFGGSGRRE